MPLSPEQIAECLKVLEGLLEHREDLLEVDEPTRKRLLEVAGRLAQPDRLEQRYLARASRKKRRRDVKASDEALLNRAEIRKKRLEPVFITPEPKALEAAAGGAHDSNPPQENTGTFEVSGVREATDLLTTLVAGTAPPSDERERLKEARVCYV